MKSLGAQGEEMAASHLRGKGYRILQRNYRTPLGEADIIALDGTTLVFVEVKTRNSDCHGQPFEAVVRKKQERLGRIALYYLKREKTERPVRFDVISILAWDKGYSIEHITDAFRVEVF
ncbi:MAG: YraN family protein [Nitrospirales bacterium]|nr:YraN family protein [Nitrospirales bacterium]